MASKIESGKFLYVEEGSKPNSTWRRYQVVGIDYIGGFTVKIRAVSGKIKMSRKDKVFTEYEPEYNFSEVNKIPPDSLNHYTDHQRWVLEDPIFN